VRTFIAGGLAAALLCVSCPVGAETNVAIAARVVSFLQPPPSGAIQMAIVFEPGNAASEADAAAIERAVGEGLSAGRAAIRTRRVPVGGVSLAGYRAAFVTAGLQAEQASIATAAARSSTVTISSDIGCVQAGHCVVGISGGSRVQIIVSRAAARASNARFGSAFLMLVKEI
jgi:hypothetical protein